MSDVEAKEIEERNAVAFAMLETRFGSLKIEAAHLEKRVMQLQREADDRRSLDAARALSKRDASQRLTDLHAMVNGSAATAEQKALLRQALTLLWRRVDAAIGEVV